MDQSTSLDRALHHPSVTRVVCAAPGPCSARVPGTEVERRIPGGINVSQVSRVRICSWSWRQPARPAHRAPRRLCVSRKWTGTATASSARRNGAAASDRSKSTTGTATGGSRATKCASVARARVADQDPSFDSADQEYVFADWTDRGFRALDHNRDGRITADEWHFDREGYRRADHNRDGVISRAEFLNETAANDEDDDRDDRFPDLDDDQDGRISKAEWHGGAQPLQCARRQSRRIPEPYRDARQRTAGGTVHQRRRQPRSRHQPGRVALVACQLQPSAIAIATAGLTQQEFAAASAVGTAGATTQSAAYRAGYERGHDRRPRRPAARSASTIARGTSRANPSSTPPTPGTSREWDRGPSIRPAIARDSGAAYRDGWDQAK